MAFDCIDIPDAKNLIENENAVVVDIRDAASFAAGAIENAIHLDNSSVTEFLTSADLERPYHFLTYFPISTATMQCIDSPVRG